MGSPADSLPRASSDTSPADAPDNSGQPPVSSPASTLDHGTALAVGPTSADAAAGQSFSTDSPNTQTGPNRVVKRRAPVACRRCRRMRSKCVHFGAKPPCEGCRIAGVSLDECVFPTRGAPDLDREYRHPRMKGDKARKEKTHRPQLSGGSAPLQGSPVEGPPTGQLPTSGPSLAQDPWDLLPPLENIIEGVNMFTNQYFQLGFIPRDIFVKQLCDNPRSVSPFLLLGLLSVSARLTPSLVTAYGDAVTTSELFMEHASRLALSELYGEPTLARCQGFYLLSIAQQGSGYKNKSFINLGIAIRMAILLQLHREETYTVEDATPAMIREAESARRTLWMIYSQDNLHAGPLAPVSLAASDITTLLPSHEEDFTDGIVPKTRAALQDTPPALENPRLMDAPKRSLFSTLIQSHQLWGDVARRAVRNDKSLNPWDDSSEYAKIQKRLHGWEANLPKDHLWSPARLKAFKSNGYELAYLAVTMVTRLSNIIIRKSYIPNMLRPVGKSQPQGFWKNMSRELFSNVKDLFGQIDVWFQAREPGDSTGAQIGIFCVYSCGLMAAYLVKYPNLCPDASITRQGRRMLDRTLDILSQSKTVWPLARRWLESLEKFAAAEQKSPNIVPSHEGSMAEGKDPIPSALHPPLTYSIQPGPPSTPLDDRRHAAKHFGPNSPLNRSASPGNAMQRSLPQIPPQILANDSLLNASVRLPLPQPQTNMVTAAAHVHYSTAHHSQHSPYAQSQQPFPSAGSVPSSTTHTPKGTVQQTQSHSLPPSLPTHQDMIAGMSVAATPGSIVHTADNTLPALATTTGPAPTLPHNNLDLLVQAFDTQSAAAVAPGITLPPPPIGTLTYQQPSLPSHGAHDEPLPPHDTVAAMAAAVTMAAEFYDPAVQVTTNDGFEHELECLIGGLGVVPGTVWGTGMFGY